MGGRFRGSGRGSGRREGGQEFGEKGERASAPIIWVFPDLERAKAVLCGVREKVRRANASGGQDRGLPSDGSREGGEANCQRREAAKNSPRVRL